MFKLRVPVGDPAGRWGMVLEPVRLPAGRIGFAYVAFGARHLPAGSSAWSVYERAHYRLVGPGE